MDPKRAKTKFPPFWKGVSRNHASVESKFKLVCFDTETFFGKVFALGIYDADGFKQSYGLNADHIGFLLDHLFNLPSHGYTTVCGAHYLVFDLGVLFWETLNPATSKAPRAPRRSFFSLLRCKTEIEIIWSKPCFAKFKRSGKTVHIIDSFAFFTMSLAKALLMVGGLVQKQEKPRDLGKRLIPKKELEPYLQADIKGGYELLKEIERLHNKYQVRLCVSLPQLSGRVFRHIYVKKDFPKPGKPLIHGALLAYHGGKNSFIGRPGWYKDCYDLDINSAYPEAMRQLPNFERGQWSIGRDLSFVKQNPHGIYRINGTCRVCPYGVIYTHEFKRVAGRFTNLWVTGYEILEGVRSGEVSIDRVYGWGFRATGDSENPFRKFVDDFYRQKQNAKSKTEGHFYKLILNSLYGKFIQRTEDEDGNFTAGSMFDPTIGSLITGFVRARLHSLEHKYSAIHTATDGFITRERPNPADLGTGLGALKQENFGPCLILRNKLYLHFDGNGNLRKSGLHGFEGNALDLEKLWKSSKRIYSISRLVKWSESWHIGLPPGTELIRKKVLNIN